MEVVTLPKLGISDEGELVAWEFEIGDELSEGDHLVTFESEKASAEVTAPAGGFSWRPTSRPATSWR